MKKIIMFFCVVALVLVALPTYAADKVVVIPLNTSKGGPGNWKSVSVSSMGGIPRTSAITTAQGDTCTSLGRYATAGEDEFLTVPIQLPDGATITALTAVICDNTTSYHDDVYLYRSDGTKIAHTGTSIAEASTTPFTKTTTNISSGNEVVDNSQYAYYLYMEIHGTPGSDLYPISGIVTLQ